MIYLDSSAVVKLLVEEPESPALERWLAARAGAPVTTSVITRVEVIRACRRLAAEVLPQASTLLEGLDLIPLSRRLVDEAGTIGDTAVRSLDAIHLASALSIRGDLSAFVAYGGRLAAAASAAGLEAIGPV